MIYTEGSQEPATGIHKVWDVDTPQVGALARAIDVTSLFTYDAGGSELNRPAADIAIDLLDALALQGWRLIHE